MSLRHLLEKDVNTDISTQFWEAMANRWELSMDRGSEHDQLILEYLRSGGSKRMLSKLKKSNWEPSEKEQEFLDGW